MSSPLAIALAGAEPVGEGTAPPEPQPAWLRGSCPRCGEALVSNTYYVSGRGYLVVWECRGSSPAAPACDYRRVL